jgi:hypothetical protein
MKQYLMEYLWHVVISFLKGNRSIALIQQQRNLLRFGFSATAEVMDVFIKTKRAGNMFCTKLWIRIKKNDNSFVYTHTNTLLAPGKIPTVGSTLHIKYLPEDLSAVAVLF